MGMGAFGHLSSRPLFVSSCRFYKIFPKLGLTHRELGSVAVGRLRLKIAACGLAIGKTFLAINRAFTGGLERDFTLFLTFGASRLEKRSFAVVAVLRLVLLEVRLKILVLFRSLVLMRVLLGKHLVHFAFKRREPFGYFGHHRHQIRQILLRGCRRPGWNFD